MGRKIARKLSATLMMLLSVVLILVILVVNIAASLYGQMVSVFIGGQTSKIVGGSNPTYFASDYSSPEEIAEQSALLCKQIVEEGAVLLKNENNTLPLADASKVTLLGQCSADLIYGGSGAGSIDTSKALDLKQAMEYSNFQINPSVWDFYTKGEGSSYRKIVPNITGAGGFTVNEVPVNLYTDEIKGSFAEFNDAAIVTIGRAGSESTDLPYGHDGNEHYLKLTQEEKDLLQMASENFEKVVVLLNTSNPMEAGFLEDYDVDACLWIGALGQEGARAIGEVLSGAVNPSGRLVDTYAYDLNSAPAMANFGDYDIVTSEESKASKYLVYAEGIYVGYRYYETRYEDVVLGNESAGNFDYLAEVQYPFGYGLSYTSFNWKDYTVVEGADEFTVSVKITNTGNYEGKEVVEIYMQSPYTDYDKEKAIEKSAVELVGFGKTGVLQPGQSEVVEVSVPKELMKVYDADGYGTYIVEAGDYYITAAMNAHDATQSILTTKGELMGSEGLTFVYTQADTDVDIYAASLATGDAITNQFEDADIRYYDSEFEYLSRSDWQGTWPGTYADGKLVASDELVNDFVEVYPEDENAVAPLFDTVSEEYGKLQLIDLKGASYDDPRWEALLSQMPEDEMFNFVRQGGYATRLLPSINGPATIDKDGPAGLSGTLAGGASSCMGYPAEIVVASTWNVEIAEEMGRMVGEDSINTGIAVWYAPAMNIHRTAFSGRNFEYYSEDGFISGKMGAAVCEGFAQKGGVVTIKHFAVNDQEMNRIGGSMFANEQSIRELYLKGFEISVREGNAVGVMASMNRIGARWTGAHAGLMTETLRNEWGFEGFVMTDQASFPGFDCNIRMGLAAGTDLWLNTSTYLWKLSDEERTPTVQNNFRNAAHNVLYAIANSNAMNGIDQDSKVVKTTPGWVYGLVILDIVFAVIIFFLIRGSVKLFKKKKVKDTIEVIEVK